MSEREYQQVPPPPTIDQVINYAIAAHFDAHRRNNKEFIKRLQDNVEKHRALLDRLAEHD